MYFHFNKAFNSVPRNALWKILAHLGFAPSHISTIQNLYTLLQDFLESWISTITPTH